MRLRWVEDLLTIFQIFFAFIHFLYVTVLQHRGFKENVEIIGEIAIFEESAANNSTA